MKGATEPRALLRDIVSSAIAQFRQAVEEHGGGVGRGVRVDPHRRRVRRRPLPVRDPIGRRGHGLAQQRGQGIALGGDLDARDAERAERVVQAAGQVVCIGV